MFVLVFEMNLLSVNTHVLYMLSLKLIYLQSIHFLVVIEMGLLSVNTHVLCCPSNGLEQYTCSLR